MSVEPAGIACCLVPHRLRHIFSLFSVVLLLLWSCREPDVPDLSTRVLQTAFQFF